MGFDLMGLRATSKKGEYFRNNVWYWRPLWEYVCEECKDILTYKDMEKGGWNNGEEITGDQALRIADRLDEAIKTGRTQAWGNVWELNQKQAKLDNEGKKMGDKEYDWREAYPFEVDNVKEFAEFCRESGGFSIC
jgi:hypothetical protein